MQSFFCAYFDQLFVIFKPLYRYLQTVCNNLLIGHGFSLFDCTDVFSLTSNLV